MRIVIADDAEMYLRLLREVFDSHPGFQVVAAVSTGEEALERVESARPDVLVCDIDLPALDGLQVAAELHARKSPTKTVLISSHMEKGYQRLAESSGAFAFMSKAGFSPDRLLTVLQSGTQP